VFTTTHRIKLKDKIKKQCFRSRALFSSLPAAARSFGMNTGQVAFLGSVATSTRELARCTLSLKDLGAPWQDSKQSIGRQPSVSSLWFGATSEAVNARQQSGDRQKRRHQFASRTEKVQGAQACSSSASPTCCHLYKSRSCFPPSGT
jgi:hypothetical protein